MNLLFGHDKAVADWVSQQKYGKPFHDPFAAFGLVDHEGHLRAGFVFTGYNGDSIELSAALDRCKFRSKEWRGFIAAVLHYAFEQQDCKRLQAHTARSNKAARMLLPRIAKFEGACRRLYGKEDGLQYALTIDDLPEFRKKWRI